MLTKTIMCSDGLFLMGNSGADWILAKGGRSSQKIFCDCTPEKYLLLKGGDVQISHSLQNSNANPHYVWVYLQHCCESAFSNINLIKNELRMCMTNEDIHHCLRLAVITLEPKLKELARSKNCHFSHQQNNK